MVYCMILFAAHIRKYVNYPRMKNSINSYTITMKHHNGLSLGLIYKFAIGKYIIDAFLF